MIRVDIPRCVAICIIALFVGRAAAAAKTEEEQLRAQLVEAQAAALQEAKDTGRFALYETLSAGVLTTLTVLAGYLVKDRKDQRDHEIERQRIEADEWPQGPES